MKIIKIIIRIIKLPLVALRALNKGELHIIRFYIDRHIIKALGLYNFRSEDVKKVARYVDARANEVIGRDHDTYSGATAPEVCSGFDVCIENIGLKKKKLRYLEIGSAKGKSMAIIGTLAVNRGLEFQGTSIDPYFDDAYVEGTDQPDRYLVGEGTYTAPIDVSSRDQALSLWRELNLTVEQIRLTSSAGLDKLIVKGEKVDLIYIDGLHDGLMPITDFLSCLKLVTNDTVIILDDRHWANVHYLRNICDNTPGLKKIFENWKIAAYEVQDLNLLTR